MANIYWAGKQTRRAQAGTLTVTTADTGGTITVTVGGTKSVIITPTTTNTTTTATELLAALQASAEGEFAEITWTSSTNVITFVGPDDGAPITIAKADGGSNATTLAATGIASPKSPHDFNDAANYAGGVLPDDTDTLIFEDSDVDCLYNLSALTAKTISTIRRNTFTGRVGLPDTNAAGGYVEYRARRLETAGLSHVLQQADGDDAGQIRLKFTSASASTVTVTGNRAGAIGDEPIDLTGLASTSTVNVSGAGVTISPKTSDSSVIAGAIRGNNATITIGPTVTLTSSTISITGGRALIQSTYPTLTMDRGAAVEVSRAAVGTTTTNDSGTLLWKSTGTFGTLVLGSTGVIDLSQAPASITPTAITMNEGSQLNDPAGRLAKTYSITLNRCGVQDVTLDLGTNYAVAVS